MDRVLAGLAFAFVYLDDIIIASPSMEQHQRDVEEDFRHLQAARLIINFSSAPLPSQRWIFWAIECPPAVLPPSPQPGGRHPKVSTAIYCEAAACLPRSVQLLLVIFTSSS
jgi:hypothetical protein